MQLEQMWLSLRDEVRLLVDVPLGYAGEIGRIIDIHPNYGYTIKIGYRSFECFPDEVKLIKKSTI